MKKEFIGSHACDILDFLEFLPRYLALSEEMKQHVLVLSRLFDDETVSDDEWKSALDTLDEIFFPEVKNGNFC